MSSLKSSRMSMAVSSRNAERLKSLKRVGILSNQPDQSRGLFIGPATTLLPALESPGINTNLERKHLTRHVETFAGFANECRVDSRDGDRVHLVSPKREATLSMLTHRLNTGHQLAK